MPGEFFFSPVAGCVAAAGRLMLALLEDEVTRSGGHYAFCDTDSMAIVATETGGAITYADLLPRLREMSSAELARLAGVDRSTIKRWRRGTVPHRSNLQKLRRVASTPG